MYKYIIFILRLICHHLSRLALDKRLEPGEQRLIQKVQTWSRSSRDPLGKCKHIWPNMNSTVFSISSGSNNTYLLTNKQNQWTTTRAEPFPTRNPTHGLRRWFEEAMYSRYCSFNEAETLVSSFWADLVGELLAGSSVSLIVQQKFLNRCRLEADRFMPPYIIYAAHSN